MPAGNDVNLQAPLPAASALERQQRSSLRVKCAVLGVLVVALLALSAGIGVNDYKIHSPQEVLDSLQTAAWLIGQFFSGYTYDATQVMHQCPSYYQVIGRLGSTFVALLCGVMVAVAGSLYQMVFRNPIAAPTMLGVNNGVSLGVIFLVIVYGGSALYMTAQRYLVCYIGAILVLAAVVALTFALGKGQLVPVDMLLIGSVISALVGQFIIYYSYCYFDDSTWALFNDLNEMTSINLEAISYITLTVAFVVSVVPIALLSFKINLVAFDPADIRMLGVDPSKLRAVALVCGTIMIISAQVHVGTVAVIALVAPFVSRSLFGVEFKKQLIGDALIGALLVLACSDITTLVRFALYSNGLELDVPIGLIANIVVMPLFAWVITLQQRSWD